MNKRQKKWKFYSIHNFKHSRYENWPSSSAFQVLIILTLRSVLCVIILECICFTLHNIHRWCFCDIKTTQLTEWQTKIRVRMTYWNPLNGCKLSWRLRISCSYVFVARCMSECLENSECHFKCSMDTILIIRNFIQFYSMQIHFLFRLTPIHFRHTFHSTLFEFFLCFFVLFVCFAAIMYSFLYFIYSVPFFSLVLILLKI